MKAHNMGKVSIMILSPFNHAYLHRWQIYKTQIYIQSTGDSSFYIFAILCHLPWLLIDSEFQYCNINLNF